jgi:hypothetical protein
VATSNANIALGYGRLYIAPYVSSSVEALPADTTAKDSAWAGNWVEVGFTSGITLSLSDERTYVAVDQSTLEERAYVTSQSVELQATLMEVTLANLKYILGYGTLSTSGSTEVLGVATNPILAEYTLGFELQAPNADTAPRRARIARCVGMPQVEMSASREEATQFQANWKAMSPPAGVNAYDIRDYTD